MAKMKYWNGTQWVPLDAANADTLEGLTVSQIRAGTTKTDVGLGNVDNVKQASKAEFDAHLADYVLQVPYAVATGDANNYAVTLDPAPMAYTEGMAIAVKINVDNTGASTINVNGLGAKTIKKPNGNDVSAGNLKAGSIYSLRYNGTNFILQGSDAAGNATPADVLAGKTFSNDQGEQVGTMPNRGAVIIIPGTSNQAIQQGYHNGDGYVEGDANLVSANIMPTKTIFGVSGGSTIYDNGIAWVPLVKGSVANGWVLNQLTDKLYIEAGHNTYTARSSYISKIKLNLTDFSSLKIDWENIGSSSNDIHSYLAVSTEEITYPSQGTAYVRILNTFDRRTTILDISSLTGEYYVIINATTARTNIYSKINVYKIWLE
jgi:hypothetical protein